MQSDKSTCAANVGERGLDVTQMPNAKRKAPLCYIAFCPLFNQVILTYINKFV